METVFNALPGIEVPVSRISAELARLWEAPPGHVGEAPSAFRASQADLIMHLGNRTTPGAALRQFETALLLARSNPCRLIVICPLREAGAEGARAKIYSQCHVGRSRREMSCCEAVIMTYPPGGREFLEYQVSNCLESDLPVCYWPQFFAEPRKILEYQMFLGRSRRIICDSAVGDAEMAGLAFPRPEAVRDLAFARLLPVRRLVARYFSGFQPAALAGPLRSVLLRHRPVLKAEAGLLLGWLQGRFAACGAAWPADVRLEPCEAGDRCMDLDVRYADGRFVQWRAQFFTGESAFTGDMGSGPVTLRARIALPAPEEALAAALFGG